MKKHRVKCAACGKETAARIPKGGDGSMFLPRRHHIKQPNGVFLPCDGNYMEAKEIS